MEYGLWNLPTGFWQAGNQGTIPIESMGRPAYYAAPNGLPVFHGPLNEGELAYAVTGSQSYRHQTEFAGGKNLLANRQLATHPHDKMQLENLPLGSDLIEPRSMESLSSDSTQHQPSQMQMPPSPAPGSVPGIDDRAMRFKAERDMDHFDPREDSNHQPSDHYMKHQSFQHPMYGMMMSQLSHKADSAVQSDSEDDDDNDVGDIDEGKSQLLADDTSTATPTPNPMFNDSADQPCRSPGSCGASSHAGFECGECGLVADTRPFLKKHIMEAHPDLPSEEADSNMATACPMTTCRFKSSDRGEMEDHVAQHVAEEMGPGCKKKICPVALQRVRYEREEYRCQQCAYSCTIEKAFYKHLKTHTASIEIVQAVPIKISCVICGKDRGTELEMNKHMKKHRDDRYFCCDICIFKTVQLKKLIQHRRMHTGEKPHLCPHCSYRSARRDNLRSHVRRVHKKENLYCDTFNPRGIMLTASTPAPAPSSSPPSNQAE